MQTKYMLLVSAITSLVLAALFSTIPVGYYDQAQVSSLLPTFFTPATYTFGIWSVIYLSWAIFGAMVALGKVKVEKTNTYLLAAAQILSSLWLIPSQFLFIGSSLIVMMGVLYLLVIGLYRSYIDSPAYQYTLELFLGWILVASIANVHLTLVAFGWYFAPVFLTVITVLLALAVNLYFFQKFQTNIIAGVLVWSLIGIIVGQQNPTVELTAGVSLIIIIVYVIYENLKANNFDYMIDQSQILLQKIKDKLSEKNTPKK